MINAKNTTKIQCFNEADELKFFAARIRYIKYVFFLRSAFQCQKRDNVQMFIMLCFPIYVVVE